MQARIELKIERALFESRLDRPGPKIVAALRDDKR
ncbi:hypothetical protein AVDCRST_MAG81-80 [uncultured Synechococcales cyanobacterium]|uniref:Uncharacterized protein n=1 Tax=uncultured Synechococcales cyanobacterium TaxID=1936017 RepID=A0A6J4UNT6_9CYAN|nr:hypothetical protein AVDCRST_MAG81-80 [uncultured Synechococcales cyanobacterium]